MHQHYSRHTARWWIVAAFAVAMAWVEAAVVYYLRTMVDRIEPYQPDPLPLIGGLGPAELVREASTLVMLLTVGMLAGSTWRTRVAYSGIAFGIWDIFYYVFLRIMTGWPHALTDWDILFLLPLPWWGPVWAPVSIALLMILWGTLVTQFFRKAAHSDWRPWLVNAAGILLALYIFMADAIRVSDQGVDVIRTLLPTEFPSLLFLLALVMMSAPIVALCLNGRWRPGTAHRSKAVTA